MSWWVICNHQPRNPLNPAHWPCRTQTVWSVRHTHIVMPYLQTQYIMSRSHGPKWSLCHMSIIGTGSRLEEFTSSMILNLQTLSSPTLNPTQVSRYWGSPSHFGQPPASSFSIFSSQGLGVNSLVVSVAWNPPNRYIVSCWLPWWKCCCQAFIASSHLASWQYRVDLLENTRANN